MSTTEPHSVALATPDGRLRVEFKWREDRFSHRILLDDVELARSIEGDACEPWPASPPLQQLSLEQIQGEAAILGVGSAGRSHWSLSAVLEPSPGQSSAFRFDLASRCRGNPGGLESTYDYAPSVIIQPCVGQIVPQESDKSGWRRLSIQPPQVSLLESEATATTTFCWSYRISASS